MSGEFIGKTDVAELVPESIASEVMKNVPQQSSVLKMAKKLTNMPSGVESIPVLSVLPIAYFQNGEPGDESGKKGLRRTTRVAWEGVKLYAEEISCIVPIENRYLEDSKFDVWGEVAPLIPEAMGLALDQAVLFGIGKPANWPTAIYTRCMTLNKKVNLGADVYGSILGKDGVVAMIEKDGYFPTGHIGSMELPSILRDIRDDLGHPIFSASMQNTGGYVLDSKPITFPENGSILPEKVAMITGAWNQLVYSFRRDMYMKKMDQAVIQDPTTKEILFNLAQQNMTGLFCFMRIAVALPNPVNATNKDKNTRYPFAILKPGTSS